MTYTIGSIIAVLGALALDWLVTKQRLVARPRFWIAYAIILFFQLVMNGFLTGLPVVTYDAGVHIGLRIANAPVEDIGFGFGMVLAALTVWSRLGAQPDPQRPSEQRQRDS